MHSLAFPQSRYHRARCYIRIFQKKIVYWFWWNSTSEEKKQKPNSHKVIVNFFRLYVNFGFFSKNLKSNQSFQLRGKNENFWEKSQSNKENEFNAKRTFFICFGKTLTLQVYEKIKRGWQRASEPQPLAFFKGPPLDIVSFEAPNEFGKQNLANHGQFEEIEDKAPILKKKQFLLEKNYFKGKNNKQLRHGSLNQPNIFRPSRSK